MQRRGCAVLFFFLLCFCLIHFFKRGENRNWICLVCCRILFVTQIQMGLAVDNTDTDRRHKISDRKPWQRSFLNELMHRVNHCHISPGYRRCPGSPVRLYDIAIENDRPLAECSQINHRPESSADQPLDFHRPTAQLPFDRFALVTGLCRPREHRIFGVDPPFAGPSHKRWNPLLNRRRTNHLRFAHFN